MFKIVDFSHLLIKTYYEKNKDRPLTFIDATCGNGFDSLYLAKTLNHLGLLVCYDIQEMAINNTKTLLTKEGFNNVLYHLLSHENLLEKHFDLIIYNLGYLPKGSKAITTKASTTLASIKGAINILSNNVNDFLIIIAIYPGHDEGLKESNLLDAFCKCLDSKLFLVTKYQNYNREKAPYIITISKTIR